MKRWTWGGNMLVMSTLVAGGFIASGRLLSSSSPEGKISQDVENLYQDLLEQAQTDARQNRLKQAVVAIAGIPSNSRYHPTAQQLREQWSQDLLNLARDNYSKSHLKEAIALLKAIPSSTSVYAQAKNLQTNWTNQSKRLEQAELAYSNGKSDQGLLLLESLRNTELYKTPRVQEMLQRNISAAFDPGDAATTLSTPEMVIPPQLTAEAPTPVQTEAEPAPELSPIAINVDSAMQFSEVSFSASSSPEDLRQTSQQIQPNQANSTEAVATDAAIVAPETSEPDLAIATSNVVVPVVTDLPATSEVKDFSAKTETIRPTLAAAFSNTSLGEDEATCLLSPESSTAAPEFSSSSRLKQSLLKLPKERSQKRSSTSNSAQSNISNRYQVCRT